MAGFKLRICTSLFFVRRQFFLFKQNMHTAFAGFGIHSTWIIFAERHLLGDVFRVFLDVVGKAGQLARGGFAGADETDFNNIAFFSHSLNFRVGGISGAKIRIFTFKSRK